MIRDWRLFGLVVTITLLLAGGCIFLGYRASWLTPEVSGVLVPNESEFDMVDMRVVMRHSDGQTLETQPDASGRFSFQAMKGVVLSLLPGDRCEHSQLEVVSRGEKKFAHRIMICDGDLLATEPPSLFLISIDLSSSASTVRERYLRPRGDYTDAEFAQIEESMGLR